MFPCGNVPHLNIVFFLSPGRIRPRQGILFAHFSQKEKQAPPFLSKRKGGKRNFTCLNFSAVQICTAHVSSVQPDRRDKTIFCRGVCSVAPLCKGSWRGFAVTEGLTANAALHYFLEKEKAQKKLKLARLIGCTNLRSLSAVPVARAFLYVLL